MINDDDSNSHSSIPIPMLFFHSNDTFPVTATSVPMGIREGGLQLLLKNPTFRSPPFRPRYLTPVFSGTPASLFLKKNACGEYSDAQFRKFTFVHPYVGLRITVLQHCSGEPCCSSTHVGVYPLRYQPTSVHTHFGPYAKCISHFGPCPLRS